MEPVESILVRLRIHKPKEDDAPEEEKKYTKNDLLKVLYTTLKIAKVDKTFSKTLLECVDITFKLPDDLIEELYQSVKERD